jgi:hypothetical protein
MYLNNRMQTLLFFHLSEMMSMHMPTLLQMRVLIQRIQMIQIQSQYSQMQSQCIQMQMQSQRRGPSGPRLLFRMQGILLGIQLILGGLDLILRSLLLHSLPLNRCHPGIFSWFSLQIHSLMARLLEIPFGNPPCRRSTTPSLRTRLGIWFPFLQEGNLSGADGSTGPRVQADGQVSRYKSRLVSKGFQQVHGIDYDETFAPVVKMDSICLALSIAAAKGWEVHQMDVKNAFLHDDLSEEIYMEKP